MNKYMANTMEQLGDRFANCVSNYVISRKMGKEDKDTALQQKEEFTQGIELVIQKLHDKIIIEQDGIGETQLMEVLDTARRIDWATAEGLLELYRIYGVVINQKFDDEFLAKIE